MSTANASDAKVQAVISYFEKVDAGDASFLGLFDDNVEFFFPKFGTTRGKDSLIAFAGKMGASLGSIWHDIPGFNFIVSGQTVVVEGQEGGTMKDGTTWPDGDVSQGRFCSVFEFSGDLITRMYIYADPDYPGHDAERISVLHGAASEA